jgi:hypothetical protein
MLHCRPLLPTVATPRVEVRPEHGKVLPVQNCDIRAFPDIFSRRRGSVRLGRGIYRETYRLFVDLSQLPFVTLPITDHYTGLLNRARHAAWFLRCRKGGGGGSVHLLLPSWSVFTFSCRHIRPGIQFRSTMSPKRWLSFPEAIINVSICGGELLWFSIT